MRGMVLNRYQGMDYRRLASAGMPSPPTPDPEVPPDPGPTWETTFVTTTVNGASTYYDIDENGVERFLTSPDFTGAEVGDIAIIFMPIWNTNLTVSYLQFPTGWSCTAINWISPYTSWFGFIGLKVLTAGDIATPPSIMHTMSGDATVRTHIYRGPISATLKETTKPGATATTIAAAGFTKSPDHQGIVSLVADRDTGTPTRPSGWNARSSVVGANLDFDFADLLDGTYDSGAVNWTGFGAVYPQMGFLVEFTG